MPSTNHSSFNEPLQNGNADSGSIGSSLETVRHIYRALIVEDSQDLGEIMYYALERKNILSVHVTHGKAALEQYAKLNPDVVLLDINLPDMTGWEVQDAIKELRARSDRPSIIVVTAYGDPANRLLGRIQGVDSFIVKPFTIEQIQNIAVEILNRRAPRN